MLILSRREGQELVIGKNQEITIMVLSRQGNMIRLGIDAPKDIPVHRREIQDKIDAENRENG